MSSYNARGATQNKFLTNYVRKLGPQPGLYIWNQIFPDVAVDTRQGNFKDVQDGFGAASPGHGIVMADGQARPHTISLAVNKVSGWTLDLHALGVELSQRSIDLERGDGFDLEAQAAIPVVRNRVYQVIERVAANLVFSTTTFTGKTAALSGQDQWDNSASDPLAQALTAKQNVIKQAGDMIDEAIVGYECDEALANHPKIREYASKANNLVGPIPDAVKAAALGVAKYTVGAVPANSAAEGQTASVSFVWGKFALFCKNRPSPSPATPQSCLQRFHMRGMADEFVKRYPLPGDYKRVVDVCFDHDLTVPTTDLGYLFSTVVA